jgi:superfamily II DNA helicase RecQ
LPECEIFRASTRRPELEFSVGYPKSAVEQAATLATKMELSGSELALFYCRTKDRCHKLANKLGCAVYHAGIEERDSILDAWSHGRAATRFLCATSALGVGIDVHAIRYVVHVGLPYGLTELIQRSGRAGRDGTVSKCTLLVDAGGAELETILSSIRPRISSLQCSSTIAP